MEFYGCPECGHKIDDLTAGSPGMKCPKCGKPMILVALHPKKKTNRKLVLLLLVLCLLIAAFGLWFVFWFEREEPAREPTKPFTTMPAMAKRRSAS